MFVFYTKWIKDNISVNARSLEAFVSVDEVAIFMQSKQDNTPTTTGLRQFLRCSLFLYQKNSRICLSLFHSSLRKFLSEEIERIQKRTIQIIFPGISYSSALAESGLLSLYERREFLSNKLFNDIVISSKDKLKSLLPPKSLSYTEHLRTRRTFELPEIHTNRFRNSFIMHYDSKHSR